MKLYLLWHPLFLLEELAGKWGSDKFFLKVWYYNRMGYWMDFKHPKTFNEKLQWLKLYNRKPKYTTMVDKYAVKRYVANIVGEEYIIPTLGVWNSFDEIDFDKLPNQFVLKCTHDSGGLIICKDKKTLDIAKAKSKIEKSLQRDFYKCGREWPYKDVPRRIIAEKYMEEPSGQLQDYKFFCFGGVVKFFKIDFNRSTNHQANYFTPDGNLMPFGEKVCPPDFGRILGIPSSLSEMIGLAEKLSQGIPFVRVDFYNITGQIYFGEITFYPASGTGPFIPSQWDEKIGQLLTLDN